MLFTVIRYLPILEEETPGHRVEMAKKAQASGTPDDTDDDDPENEKTDLLYDHCYHSLTGLQAEHNFHIEFRSYRHPVEKIHTPPPQV
jgi:hypothetical protein